MLLSQSIKKTKGHSTLFISVGIHGFGRLTLRDTVMIFLVRCVPWCNSGVNAMGRDPLLFYCYQSLLHQMDPIPDTINKARKQRLDRYGSQKEPACVIVLKERNKMTLDDILFIYPRISESITQPSTEMLLLAIDGNAETHN